MTESDPLGLEISMLEALAERLYEHRVCLQAIEEELIEALRRVREEAVLAPNG